MRNAWLFCLILGTARHASAQSSSLALLRMDSTPATLALGPAGAYLTGTHAIGVNPASLPTERYEVFAQHQSGLAQTTLQSVRGVFPLPRLRAALGVSFLRLDSRGLEGRTELGQPTGSFRQSDAVLGLHGSLALPFDRADAFHLGAGVKRLTSELAGRSAATLAFDGGLTYRREALSLGLSLLNVGKGLTYLAEASPLPRTLVISGAYRLAAPFTVMASVSRLHVERATELTLGTQYWFMDAIALRFRYTGSSALGGNGLGGAAGGLGLRVLGNNTVDYAFQAAPDGLRAAGLLGSHQLSFTARFGSPSAPARGGTDDSSVFRSSSGFAAPYRAREARSSGAPKPPRQIRTQNTSVTWW